MRYYNGTGEKMNMNGSFCGRLRMWIGIVSVLIVTVAMAAMADTVRLVNGSVVEGEVTDVNNNGLIVRTPEGDVTLAWETLSPGTRFRYQPEYRANYGAILEGLPPAARTNRPVDELLRELE